MVQKKLIERTMVPRDQGRFNIATIEMYFFPGSGLSIHHQFQHAVMGKVGEKRVDALGRAV
jgi:hypothetical protein